MLHEPESSLRPHACSEAFVLENVLGLKHRHQKVLATTHRLLREADYVRSPAKASQRLETLSAPVSAWTLIQPRLSSRAC